MPRRFWVLVGWVIALTTLATAASVVQHTYNDLQRIGECDVPNLADPQACADQRLIEGAAKMAATVARVPAFGLAAIATAIGFAARRTRSSAQGSSLPNDGLAQGPAGSLPTPEPQAVAPPSHAAAPSTPPDLPTGEARVRRRSKTPSTTLDEAAAT